MTSIPIAIYRFSDNNFKTLLSPDEKTFCRFLLHFQNVHEIQNILKQKNSILA